MSAAPVIDIELVVETTAPVSLRVLPRTLSFPSWPRFRRFAGGDIELRIELTAGRNHPIIQAWCIGLGPDVHRVCYSVDEAKQYFIDCGVPKELRVDALLYARQVHKDERERYYSRPSSHP